MTGYIFADEGTVDGVRYWTVLLAVSFDPIEYNVPEHEVVERYGPITRTLDDYLADWNAP